MILMTLCPNCKTIQKYGTACTICKCPIQKPHADSTRQVREKTEKRRKLMPDRF